ncbi:branched-subunit amino acid transport protein [Actinoplanes campanulatus]|uniref:Branched-subunit amino acid transport protein n=1 Tax=Actinoplanes campanulatus TaxID=113559 RepID=A0A7W5AQ98_9ACTN|nr:AzlD domain-containing protein [Actinoplanes campanulatus]MBB3099959.1 branched-subunit amino acid transport protein [Actinoplanes campanulatus]GGN29778.1 branched-chain amino acid transporter [Actinoplanes campanulatus]GID42198.1 branched-chain amino acid transporter [Actinoplanes campanulatus]
MLITAILILAAGTYAIRLSGVVLRDRLELSESLQRLLPMSAAALLAALAGTAALMAGSEFAGFARPAGVLAGGLLAWRKAPFVVVVVVAAAVTALLRLAGVE